MSGENRHVPRLRSHPRATERLVLDAGSPHGKSTKDIRANIDAVLKQREAAIARLLAATRAPRPKTAIRSADLLLVGQRPRGACGVPGARPMMTDLSKCKEGDHITAEDRAGNLLSIRTVTGVGQRYITLSNGQRVKFNGHPWNSNRFPTIYFRQTVDEDKDKLRQRILAHKLLSLDWNKLPLDALDAVAKLLTKKGLTLP